MINLNWSKKDLYFCHKETGIYMARDPIILWIKLFYNVSIRGDDSMYEDDDDDEQQHKKWLEKRSICRSKLYVMLKNDAKELEEVAKIASLLDVALAAKANATNTEDLASKTLKSDHPLLSILQVHGSTKKQSCLWGVCLKRGWRVDTNGSLTELLWEALEKFP